jgi:hypothetical protein
MLHASPDATLVYRGDALEMLDRLVRGVAWRHLDAGIVEGHVEPTVLCDRAVDHRRHLRLVGDVAGDANCGAALEDNPFGLFRGEIAVDVG